LERLNHAHKQPSAHTWGPISWCAEHKGSAPSYLLDSARRPSFVSLVFL
jgi:hypothetical protein